MSGEIVVGIVKDLDDPAGLGRVQVTFPHLEDQESNWARLVTPMAGKDRGMFFRPEKGDEVLVAFEQGDLRRPFIIGSLWSKVDKPPVDDGKKTKNNWRFIKSRSGHLLKLDDTKGKERIEIIANDKKKKIIIDTSGKKIQIICSDGDIEVQAPKGNVTVKANSAAVDATNIELKGKSSVKVQAPSVEIKATAAMKLEAGGPLTIKGALVKIN